MFSLFTFAKVISTNCKHVCVALTCSYQLMITRIRAICIKLKLIYKNVISTIFVEIQFSGISLLSWTFRKSTEFETTNLYRTPVLIFFNLYFTQKIWNALLIISIKIICKICINIGRFLRIQQCREKLDKFLIDYLLDSPLDSG